MTVAPYSSACASLPLLTCPAGRNTTLFIPARAAYAATEAEVFPVEAQHTDVNPSALATEMAADIPESLNDPVGFIPKCLDRRLRRRRVLAACFSGNSGVLPSA